MPLYGERPLGLVEGLPGSVCEIHASEDWRARPTACRQIRAAPRCETNHLPPDWPQELETPRRKRLLYPAHLQSFPAQGVREAQPARPPRNLIRVYPRDRRTTGSVFPPWASARQTQGSLSGWSPVTIHAHSCELLSRSCSSAALHLHWRASLTRTPPKWHARHYLWHTHRPSRRATVNPQRPTARAPRGTSVKSAPITSQQRSAQACALKLTSRW